ncbi:hypothetical protein CLV59_107381 [Chitinophaga dinghuensis]|uniref:Uncharacterized protein n=1 Tax=Chitinophaga dinghuensis TaxID=1539050 RepID=A0A327W0P3_9BACT|nr:DNA-binding protein [Chitinophaga dinghuensis]RAJ77612.1 hypothetical protein CLV59_107381 [Chitinophaga dinghuensis]
MNNVEKSEKAFTPMFFPYAPDQFLEQIRTVVREEVMPLERNQPTPVLYKTPGLTQKPIYKITEVCQLFQGTKPTIHSW